MIYRQIKRWATKDPARIIIVGERRTLTYRQLLEEVDACAAYFQSLDIKAQTPVLIGIPPAPEFYVAFFAACAIGATAIPLLPSTSGMAAPVRDCKPEVAVGSRAFLNAVRSQLSGRSHELLWDAKNGLHLPKNLQGFKKSGLVREEKVLALPSSGSTGEPMLRYRTAEIVVKRAQLRAELTAIRGDDVLLTTRPINSGAGFSFHVTLPVLAGCKVVVHEKFQRFKAAEAIAKERVTVLNSVPLVFELLASIPSSYPVDFSSLRLCMSGGAPLSRYVREKFYQRYGLYLRQRYGGRHFSPACAWNYSDVPDAVGQKSGPFPLTILNEDGREVGPDQIGEVAFDYSKMAPIWKKALKDNPNRFGKFLHTGDLGRVDMTGNVFIVGRKSRFIKVASNRVEPAEVENVLRSHPMIRDAVVFALNAGTANEAVGAIVAASAKLTLSGVLGYCAERLEPYKCPRRIEFRRSLPHNAHGKVMRHIFDKAREQGPI